jgi:hypothetical protein
VVDANGNVLSDSIYYWKIFSKVLTTL